MGNQYLMGNQLFNGPSVISEATSFRVLGNQALPTVTTNTNQVNSRDLPILHLYAITLCRSYISTVRRGPVHSLQYQVLITASTASTPLFTGYAM